MSSLSLDSCCTMINIIYTTKSVSYYAQTHADPTKCDEEGRNALHHACRHEVDEGTKIEELLTLLLQE